MFVCDWKRKCIWKILFFLLTYSSSSYAYVQWLSIASADISSTGPHGNLTMVPGTGSRLGPPPGPSVVRQEHDECDQITGLIRKQRKICKQHREEMKSVRKGAGMSLQECRHQFQQRRWNCTVDNQQELLRKITKNGIRESAFVHAIAAAGVAYTVTKSCSSGELANCGCDLSVEGVTDEGFRWSGCSDNLLWGIQFSSLFHDARERYRKRVSGKSLMNLHNNQAGRKLLENSVEVACKCHGVSGSCEMKTCWRALASFRKIGGYLKEKFDGATEVKQEKIGSRRHLVARNPNFKRHTVTDLVYLRKSPTFCEPDLEHGSLGTRGRRCSPTSKGLDGCGLMCCNRGYDTKVMVVEKRCNCKFHWCCFVECDTCSEELEVHTCK